MDEGQDLKKDFMFKEWEILWKRILFADGQIDTIKNWCIVTLVGFFGLIMSLSGIDATRNIIVNNAKIFYLILYLILYLPFLAIIFFALNEIIKQFWKLEAFERLYDLDQFFDTEKRNGSSCKQSSKYTPLFSTEEVKEKIRNRRKYIGSRMWRSTVNSLLALNFAFFYGLLLVIYSILVSQIESLDNQRLVDISLFLGLAGIIFPSLDRIGLVNLILKEIQGAIAALKEVRRKKKEVDDQ